MIVYNRSCRFSVIIQLSLMKITWTILPSVTFYCHGKSEKVHLFILVRNNSAMLETTRHKPQNEDRILACSAAIEVHRFHLLPSLSPAPNLPWTFYKLPPPPAWEVFESYSAWKQLVHARGLWPFALVAPQQATAVYCLQLHKKTYGSKSGDLL